jgi:hypothetical protein
MPIKTLQRLFGRSDPFDDFVTHSKRVLAYTKTMKKDAKKCNFRNVRGGAKACRRIIGRQMNKNSQQLISLWRKKFHAIHTLLKSKERTKLTASLEVLKHWVEELLIAINNTEQAAKVASELPKNRPQPDITPTVTKAEKAAIKMVSHALEIKKLYNAAKNVAPKPQLKLVKPSQQKQKQKTQTKRAA